MYTFVYCRIHEREQSIFGSDGYSIKQHTPQGGWEQQQCDDTANLISQFINEEISVTMRKRLEMEVKSYPQDDQHLSQLSLPFDFKIQWNHYHIHKKVKLISS